VAVFFVSVAVANQRNGFVPALRVDLLHDAVDVILDGEFGQVQIGNSGTNRAVGFVPQFAGGRPRSYNRARAC
jgi:hypothetical protein